MIDPLICLIDRLSIDCQSYSKSTNVHRCPSFTTQSIVGGSLAVAALLPLLLLLLLLMAVLPLSLLPLLLLLLSQFTTMEINVGLIL